MQSATASATPSGAPADLTRSLLLFVQSGYSAPRRFPIGPGRGFFIASESREARRRDLEPDVRCPFLDAPAIGEGIHQLQAHATLGRVHVLADRDSSMSPILDPATQCPIP